MGEFMNPITAADLIDDVTGQIDRFYGVIFVVFVLGMLYVMFRMLSVMPKTKPQEIKASKRSGVTWDDIAGVEATKDELREVVEFLSDPKRFKTLGAKVPKGILLHGPPGTGKTMLAKAVAHESGANFFSQSASSFVEMFAGLGAARIRRLFKEARENSPAILFIDELDAVGTTRGNDVSGERDQTLNQLLVEMDGFEASENIVVMAASNLLEKLDPALLRPGRFDRQVFVPPPDLRAREEILKVHTRDKPLSPDIDLKRVAQHSSGLTGADLGNLCNEAAIQAGRAQRSFISQADFDNAFERVVAGLQSRKVITDDEKRVVAWHEAGHALVSELLPTVDKVQKVSIVPRGKALGYTLNLPQEDRYLKSRQELIDYMKVLLGGRVAEQITFGRVTTGASDDLSKVTMIARSMVYEYGMGTSIRSHQVPANDWNVSEMMRQRRDEEVAEIAEEAYRGAQRLITDHRDLLDEIANKLLVDEVIEQAEIAQIMREHRDTSLSPKPAHEPPILPRPESEGAPASRVAEAIKSAAAGADAPQGSSQPPPPPPPPLA
ncbi:MAG: ATP-dependent zinc metalloprotease FtsH [Solirubrobacterales bacterium]|nr:ATP-dependent zinc metalloprotease FtsH [Solirubrobacterales bacterium]